MRIRLLAALLSLSLTPACFLSRSHINQPLAEGAVAELIPGQSTADDVLNVLGAPSDVVQLWKRTAWRYDHTESKNSMLVLFVLNLGKTDAKQDRVWVFFDEYDTLTHIGGTFEADEVSWGLPF